MRVCTCGVGWMHACACVHVWAYLRAFVSAYVFVSVVCMRSFWRVILFLSLAKKFVDV